MTNEFPPPSNPVRFHRIRSISIIGGFLDGVQFELDDGLNCLIGGRGTGKTTALEFVRYALDTFPEDEYTSGTRKRVESLISSNLGGGRIQLTIETRDGLTYTISRTADEDPMIMNSDGQPTTISLKSGGFFKADIFSQNEVENIADDPLSQLALIDSFEADQIREIEAQLGEVEAILSTNANQIIETRKQLQRIKNELNGLPSIREKLKGLVVTTGENADAINQAHTLKALRGREKQAVDNSVELLQKYNDHMIKMAGTFNQRVKSLFGQDLLSGPNETILQNINRGLLDLGNKLDGLFQEALQHITDEQTHLSDIAIELGTAHNQQELAFRNLIEKHKEAQGQSKERADWEKKQNDLLAKERICNEVQDRLKVLQAEREKSLQSLSELRDQRFALREAVAERMNREVSTQKVRVRILQYGNPKPYQDLLEQGLKNAKIQHKMVTEKIVSTLSPTELSTAILNENESILIKQADLNPSQAKNVISALSDSQALLQLEIVELIDLPKIELLDGTDYKDSLSLSTGQKCTTILPILLLDSENPLLIDQPEDNLDNAFIYDTVVQSLREIKSRRQLMFVTHNPNIPVLGDAEKIFVLESSGKNARKVKEGTVDECKNYIVSLLEGGEEAFKKRQNRYKY